MCVKCVDVYGMYVDVYGILVCGIYSPGLFAIVFSLPPHHDSSLRIVVIDYVVVTFYVACQTARIMGKRPVATGGNRSFGGF